MALKLFDGSDSENENDDSEIKVDKEFARRYEHNKKREDLQRYEELKKRGVVPRRFREGDEDSDDYSSSSSSDDDGGHPVLDRSEKDLEFFEALIKVRKKDPVLKSKDVKLFDSDSDENEDNDGDEKKEKKKKAMYLKDVVAKQLIEEGPEFAEDEEESGGAGRSKKLVYDEEQEAIRSEFLKAVEGGGGEEDGDLLTVRAKSGAEEERDDNELMKKVDEYFEDELDENGKFLKEYFLNRMWIDKRGGEGDGDDDGDVDDEVVFSEDEEEVEKQEEYEFRFQENVGDRVLGHSREVEGTVRKKVKARKEQRKSKQERMEIARKEREDELKHLKNLKKKEMDERVRKVMEVAGIKEDDVVPLSAKELEEEFDPEAYDRMMRRAFGDEYYSKMESGDDDDEGDDDDDDDDDDEKEKPNFDEEDELLGLPKGWDGREADDDGFLAARERSLKHKAENESIDEEDTKVGKRKRKQKLALLEKAKKAMLEEYYKLDYEDTIGDLKTRFRYSNVNGNRYGLNTAAILMMDDNELNQYVSMKKIVPYSDKEWKVPNDKRFEMKMKANELLRKGRASEGTFGRNKRGRGFEANTSRPSSSGVAGEGSKAPLEDPAGEPRSLSKTAKRRRNQADLKLSHSRLMAYEKITPKQKKKAKR